MRTILVLLFSVASFAILTSMKWKNEKLLSVQQLESLLSANSTYADFSSAAFRLGYMLNESGKDREYSVFQKTIYTADITAFQNKLLWTRGGHTIMYYVPVAADKNYMKDLTAGAEYLDYKKQSTITDKRIYLKNSGMGKWLTIEVKKIKEIDHYEVTIGRE